MSEHDTRGGAASTHDEPEPSADFDAEVPSEPPSPHGDDDWPEGGLDDDGREDVEDAPVTTEDPVHPAMGERFADVHAERPWLLPSLAGAVVLAIVAVLVLTRRD